MKKYSYCIPLYVDIDDYDYDRIIFHSSFSLLIKYVEHNYEIYNTKSVDFNSKEYTKWYYGYKINKREYENGFDFLLDEKIINLYLWYIEFTKSIRKDKLQTKNTHINLCGQIKRLKNNFEIGAKTFYYSRYDFKKVTDIEEEKFIEFSKIRKYLYI